MHGRVISGEREASIEALRARAARAAAGFQALGAGGGGAVALLLRNDFPFFECQMGCRMAGAYMVPINWHSAPDEVDYILRDCAARALVVHADLWHRLRQRLVLDIPVLVVPTPPEIAAAYGSAEHAAPAPGDTLYPTWRDGHAPLAQMADPPGANMLYTSGTTGRPKGVRRAPMREALAQAYARRIAAAFGIEPGMRGLMTGPLYHSAPNGFASVGLTLGCELWLMPRFEPQALLAMIERHRLTHMHLVPVMFVRLLRLPEAVRRRHDLSSLRCIVHGAAPCPPEIKRRMIEWLGPVVREYYGSTEGSVIAACSSEQWLSHPGTVGPALEGATIEIHDAAGNPLPPGEEGEIYGMLDSMPPFTYHNRDEERRAVERRGLITNGDVGYLDADGYLYLCDRKKDMIISGGVNIYPAEIEAVLIDHPAVRDCCVFGIPQDEFGEAVAAAVELEPGSHADAGDLQLYLGDHLARFKVPQLIEFHAALPREDNGKIYKRRLRAAHWARAGRRI